MNRDAHAAGLLVSEAFWRAPSPVALVSNGPRKPDVEGVPSDHLLFATSGSSGVPKWIVISKNALLASANVVNAHLGVDVASVWGLALPVHHVGGFGVIARARAAGCRLECFDQAWTPRGFAEWVETRRITHTSLVPTQVHDLVAAGCPAPASLLAIVVGGGRLDTATGRAARGLGWPVLASYGMTEAASQIATQPLDALGHPYDSAPIAVLPHWQTRVDREGCLEIAGPALFSGIASGGVYQPFGGDWYATRDRVSLTSDGIIPHGRADTRVKVAGELVDPLDVEARLADALQTHGHGIAVAAIPDSRLGNRLAVFAERGTPPAALAAAIDAHDRAVPRSQRLGEPRWIDELPRSPLGKILRPALLEMPGLNADEGCGRTP